METALPTTDQFSVAVDKVDRSLLANLALHDIRESPQTSGARIPTAAAFGVPRPSLDGYDRSIRR
jgi:hypothetical protein